MLEYVFNDIGHINNLLWKPILDCMVQDKRFFHVSTFSRKELSPFNLVFQSYDLIV